MGTRRGMPLPRRVAFLSKRGFFTNICEEPTNESSGGRVGIFKVPGARFAYQNGNQRVSGESYANRGGDRTCFFKNPGARFAHQNRNQWVSGESYANSAGDRTDFPLSPGPKFAPGNRKLWLCGEASANCAGGRSAYTKKAASQQRNSLFSLLELLKWLITEREP